MNTKEEIDNQKIDNEETHGSPVYQVPGLSKGIRLIELLAKSPIPLGLSEIAQRLGQNKHMVFRILQTLIRENWVTAIGETPKYRLTLVPFRVTSQPLFHSDLLEIANDPIRQYWREVGESTSLGVWNDDRVLYVVHHNSVRDVGIIGQAGRQYYLHCSAAGKVLLAYADQEQQNRILSQPLKRLTLNTIVNPRSLQEELEKIRRYGYAIDNEEYATGVICFAAPIFNHTGAAIGALNTSVLTMHYTMSDFEKRVGLRLIEVCRAISTLLGYEEGKTD